MSQKNKEKPRSWDILGVIIGALILGFLVSGIGSFLFAGKQYKYTPPAIPRNTSTPTPTENPSPTPQPTPVPVYQPPAPSTAPWGQSIKLNDKTTGLHFGPDDRMATGDELLAAINQYRQVRGLPTLNRNDILCNVAQIRANDQQALGRLDEHQGFTRFYYDPTVSQAFWHTGEILWNGNGQPNLAVHIVEWGWGQSLTGHREEMLKTIWTDGCGGVAGYFAAFVFGARN